MQSITTDSGTTVTLVASEDYHLVIADHPDAPEDMRNKEIGRIINGGFQPALFSAFALRPQVLRALAGLIENDA